jgi:membrane protease YdiL (CAAX protease family)
MNQTLTTRSAFALIFISIVLAFLSGSIILGFGNTYLPNSSERPLIYMSLLFGQSVMLIPVVFYLWANRLPIKEQIRFNPVSGKIITATVVLSSGIIIISDEIDRILNAIFPQPEFINSLSQQLQIESIEAAILIPLLIVFLAPIVEEILFRGFLQKFLEEAWRDITRAVLVTSLFFALIHFNPYWIIQIYLLGLMLGYLAWYTGSIIPPIILHILNNAYALTLENSALSRFKLLDLNGHISPIMLAIAALCIYLGFKLMNNSKAALR